jgi:hypothetical protein
MISLLFVESRRDETGEESVRILRLEDSRRDETGEESVRILRLEDSRRDETGEERFSVLRLEDSEGMRREKNSSGFLEIRLVIRPGGGECRGSSDPRQEKTIRSSTELIRVLRNPTGHQTRRRRMQRVIRPEAGEDHQVFDRTHQGS